jgi:hypothetical protein
VDYLTNSLGGLDKVASYVVPLLEWAQEMLVQALGTEKLQMPKEMEAPFMKMIGKESNDMKAFKLKQS